ncbi:hypothetical protein OJF2_38680 [Aquisphaera giovannonii]|uniref:Uncharacterized protein n=2 Tax=Aquisphaera giovannonii TaxID=406548 RepID=A0A5B9W4X0_9BACT|nr:hypothetical protein OJF2_38680 [Aquisphaera giovannonii]
MAKLKSWYDPEASQGLRVVPREDRETSYVAQRWKHPRVRPTLGECLLYPLSDGPGLGLLFLFPPALWVLSLPVFDFIAMLEPLTKSDWALGLVVVPIFLPMLFSFSMTFGYVLLFLGHILVASAMGENDQPRWPEWHPADIAEGIGRWIWALLFGAAVAGLPLAVYWSVVGTIDWRNGFVIADLVILGAAFGQMGLAAALMHDTIIAANPITVLAAIARIGWGYLFPCLVTAVAMALAGLGVYGLLYRMPRMWMEAVSLWAFWVFVLYEAMVVMRMIGLTYHAHAMELVWFRRRPRWASARLGRIYANS